VLRTLTAIIAAAGVLGLAACSKDDVSVTVKTGSRQGAKPPDTGDSDEGGGVIINDEGAERRVRCSGGAPVTINADDVTVTLTGPCGPLVVNGDSATVTAESVRAIQFNGDSSRVSYSSGKPPVTENGDGNRVVRS
jgi:hypothetical protein